VSCFVRCPGRARSGLAAGDATDLGRFVDAPIADHERTMRATRALRLLACDPTVARSTTGGERWHLHGGSIRRPDGDGRMKSVLKVA